MEVDFAFPTQSVHVESFPEKKGLERHQEEWDKTSIAAKAAAFAGSGEMAKPQGLGVFDPSK